MTRIVAAISVVAQIMGIAAFGWLLFEFFTLPGELLEHVVSDPDITKRFVEETLVSYRPWFLAGFVGGFVGWLLILKAWCRDAWFMATSRVLAWIWLPLIPVGTVIGALLLSARRKAVNEKDEGHQDT